MHASDLLVFFSYLIEVAKMFSHKRQIGWLEEDGGPKDNDY